MIRTAALLLALLLAPALAPTMARAAATPAQLDTMMRYYAYLAGEPLTAAETATIRQATIEFFDQAPGPAAERLARATRALTGPPMAKEIDEPLRSMAIASLGLDSMSQPAGPDARIYPILDKHFDHAQQAPSGPAPIPAPLPAPAVSPAAPPAPPARPVPATPPSAAQLDNVIAIAEWTLATALTAEEKEAVRQALRAGANDPAFRKALIDVPAADLGSLYRRSPDDLAAARDELVYGPKGLYSMQLGMAGVDDPDGAFRRFSDALVAVHARVVAAAGPTQAVFDTVHACVETLIDNRLLPTEAARIDAAIRALYQQDPRSAGSLLGTCRVMAQHLRSLTGTEQTDYADLLIYMIDGALKAGGLAGDAALDGFQAVVDAYARLYPPTADAPAVPSLLPTPGKR